MSATRNLQSGWLWLGLALLSSPAAAQKPSRIGGEILELLEARQEKAGSELRARLCDLGPAAVAPILSLLSGELQPARSTPGLDAGARAFLIDALACWPSELVVSALRGGVGENAPLQKRLCAVELIGMLGDAGAIDAVVDLASAASPAERQHGLMIEETARALSRILKRDPRALMELQQLGSKVEVSLFTSMASALVESGRHGAILFLQGRLRGSDALDAVILEALGRLVPWAEPGALESAAQAAGLYLDAPQEDLRRLAALCLGRLRDAEAFAELARCLEDSEARVQRAAHWALEQLAARTLPFDRAACEAWHSKELSWWESRGPRLLEALEGEDSAAIVEALRELCDHALFRRQSTPRIALLLRSESPSVAQSACAALERLDGKDALPALHALLTAGEADLRQAASRAFRALSGREPPESNISWLEWTSG
jgi:HEAT repeat protein